MLNSLKGRLWVSNIIILAITISLILVFVHIVAVNEFDVYKINELEKSYENIFDIVTEQYRDNNWDTWVLETVGADILEEKSVIITLYNEQNTMLYDSITMPYSSTSSTHMGWGMMHGYMSGNMMGNMNHYNSSAIEQIKRYNEKEFEILNNGNKIGTLLLASTEFYNSNEQNYLNKTTQIIIFIGIITTALAIIVSNFFSHKISQPITRIISVAEDIAKGDYGKTVEEKTNILELKNLTVAINDLSDNLKQHETLRKRLTQDVAHELRTPISTMQGNLEAVLDGIWEMDEERTKILYDEVLRLSRLVADMNNLSKYENSVLNKTTFDIKDVWLHVMSSFEGALLEKNIQTTLNVSEVKLYADKDKLTQVFVNLMANAMKFTPDGGSICVSVVKEKGSNEIVFSVLDTGIGISEEDLPYVFERFYRVDKSRNRKSGGAGIGLSVVKAVVKAHDGTVDVNSRLGEGTEFVIRMPIIK